MSEAAARHRIPIIDRMMDVFAVMERRESGASIGELVEALALPRTTLYRMLNTLQRHEMVRRADEGRYRLGPRLLALSARVAGSGAGYDLAALAQAHLAALAAETGEACKVSVLEGDLATVRIAVPGKREYALTVSPGQRLPLHAGAASKVLLAHLPADQRLRLIAAPLRRYTPRTITDRKRLAAELARIRRSGHAADCGEFLPSVHAYAAPIRDREGTVIAALSVPFLAGSDPSHVATIKSAVARAAEAITASISARAGD